jgi:outer membrane protein
MRTLFAGLIAGFFALPAAAGNAWDLELEAAIWETDADGSISVPDFRSYNIEMDESTLNNERNLFFSATLEHPNPYLPNLKLSQSRVQHEGKGTFLFELVEGVPTLLTITGEIDLIQSDIALYYPIPAGPIVLDAGLSVRLSDGHLAVDFSTQESPLDSELVMFYLRAEGAALPELWYGAEAYAGYASDKKGADINLYLRYETPVGVGITTGYRWQDLEYDTKANALGQKWDAEVELKIEGPYLSLFYHFPAGLFR